MTAENMASGVYKFSSGPDTIARFGAKNRPSTDALGALVRWRDSATGRAYDKIEDTDEYIVARVTWNDDDASVAGNLNALLAQYGLQHEYLPDKQ